MDQTCTFPDMIFDPGTLTLDPQSVGSWTPWFFDLLVRMLKVMRKAMMIISSKYAGGSAVRTWLVLQNSTMCNMHCSTCSLQCIMCNVQRARIYPGKNRFLQNALQHPCLQRNCLHLPGSLVRCMLHQIETLPQVKRHKPSLLFTSLTTLASLAFITG